MNTPKFNLKYHREVRFEGRIIESKDEYIYDIKSRDYLREQVSLLVVETNTTNKVHCIDLDKKTYSVELQNASLRELQDVANTEGRKWKWIGEVMDKVDELLTPKLPGFESTSILLDIPNDVTQNYIYDEEELKETVEISLVQ